MKWIGRIILLGFIGFIGWGAYDMYRGGFFSLPDLPDRAYPISFGSGFRAIVYDIDASDKNFENGPKWFRRLASANPDRKYLGLPAEVPVWFKDVWSTCEAPTNESQTFVEQSMSEEVKSRMVGARLDAICYIPTDDERRLYAGSSIPCPNCNRSRIG